jgi:hypothetical protein
MKISHNHPILTQGNHQGDSIVHNGLTYQIIDEDFGFVELEPERLRVWKKRRKF